MARKIEALECLRGIAALMVVANHLLIGFVPFRSGQFESARPHPIIGSLWNGLFNGSAAVSFFFVLSGFVLSWGVFKGGGNDGEGRGSAASAARGLIKRWPRLAGPCTLAVLGSWALFAGGLYRYAEAAKITASPWLQDFGYAGLPPNFDPSILTALASGSFRTFLRGDAGFDSSLWTMRPEITGSVVVLLLAPALYAIRQPIPTLILLFFVIVLTSSLNEFIVQFAAGALLARIMWGKTFSVGPVATGLCVLLAYGLFAYKGSVGIYEWLAPIIPPDWHYYAILWVPASMLTIFIAMNSPSLARLLSGTWARILGRLSFPIYLVHVPVLCSLGAWVLVRATAMMDARLAVLVASVCTVIGTFLIAWPLSQFDRWWVGRLNVATAILCGARRGPSEYRSMKADFESGVHFLRRPSAVDQK